MYFIHDIQVDFSLIDIKGAYVTRLGKTFFRRQYSKNIDKKIIDLATQTLATRELPTNTELLPVLGNVIKDVITDPIGAIARGKAREQLVKDILHSQNVLVPPKSQLILRGGREATKAINTYVKNNREDLTVNTVGTLSSIVGASSGIPGAKYIGDLGGALVARKGIQDLRATKAAISKIKTDEAFRQAGLLEKLKQTHNTSLSELKEMALRGEIKEAKVDDVGGFLVGNAIAESAQKVNMGVPLIGASGAMAVAKDIRVAAKRIESGENKRHVVTDTLKKLANRPKRFIDKGLQREQKLRDKVNTYLKSF